MQRQRDSSQKKEQEKDTTRDLIKTKISNMPDPKFKATNIGILTGLEEKIEVPHSRDKKTEKPLRSKLKNAITET